METHSEAKQISLVTCDGTGQCSAPVHLHGCYADYYGICNSPEEHYIDSFELGGAKIDLSSFYRKWVMVRRALCADPYDSLDNYDIPKYLEQVIGDVVEIVKELHAFRLSGEDGVVLNGGAPVFIQNSFDLQLPNLDDNSEPLF